MTEPTLDDHLAVLGDRLEQSRARAERRRRQLLAGAGIAVATVAVSLGALVAVPGGRQLDPVAEARAALETDGGLLHYVLFRQSLPPEGSKLPPPDSDAPGIAVWTATTGPERYRIQTPAMYCSQIITMTGDSLRKRLTQRLTGVPLVAPTEHAATPDGTATTYSPFSKAIIVIERKATPAPTAAPAAGGLLFGTIPETGDPRDPVRVIREALGAGRLRDDGIVADGGRRLRRLVGEVPATPKRETRPTQLTYLVDADSFVPVELRSRRWATWSRAGGRNHDKWMTDIARFEDFERLPDTPANRALLKIEPPPGTTRIRIDARNRISPSPLPERLRLGSRDRAAVDRCEAATPPGR